MEHYITQETKHFQNVMSVGMASEISKNYTDIQVCGLLKTMASEISKNYTDIQVCGLLKTQQNQGCQC